MYILSSLKKVIDRISLRKKLFIIIAFCGLSMAIGILIGNYTIKKVQIGGENYAGIELKNIYIDQLARSRANLNLINSLIFSALWEYDEEKLDLLANLSVRMDELFAEMQVHHQQPSENNATCISCHTGDINANHLSLLDSTLANWSSMHTLITGKIIPLLEEDRTDDVGYILDEQYFPLYYSIMGSSKDAISGLRAALDSLKAQTFALSRNLTRFYAIGGSISIILVFVLAFLFVQIIVTTIYSIIDELNESADLIAAESSSASDSAAMLAEMTGEIASSLEETSASLEEIGAMIQQNDQISNNANQSMQTQNQIGGKANRDMELMQASMEKIKTESEKISVIINDIDNIAFQTNLLALNAAVEAARAGEAGAGFAVVADEVRNLASRTAESAHKTSELVENAVNSIGDGLITVQSVTAGMAEVTSSSEKIGTLITEMATTSHEQSLGIQQINNAISQMDQNTQELAATSDKSASASQALTDQTLTLRENIKHLTQLIEGKSKTR